MTNEEAIKNLKKLKSFHNGSYGTAINLAIKALEQTDVLEKIRAEIVQMNEGVLKMLMPFDGLEKMSYTTGFIDGLGSTLDVIDNYREEDAE